MVFGWLINSFDGRVVSGDADRGFRAQVRGLGADLMGSRD